ncbi:uncharacterized protein LOC135485588 isoform X2 [Lineus longissimus]|uniref:uncharacterized protein LOC135485588 isoform X2 n=1 Tax=Lineus longissimus TaxID=88925 RepID=UPI00315CE769
MHKMSAGFPNPRDNVDGIVMSKSTQATAITQFQSMILPNVPVRMTTGSQDFSVTSGSSLTYPQTTGHYSNHQSIFNFSEGAFRKEEKDAHLGSKVVEATQSPPVNMNHFQKSFTFPTQAVDSKSGIVANVSVADEKGMSPLSIVPMSYQDGGQPSPASSTQSLPNNQALRYQASGRDAMLSAINYNEAEMLHEGGFDVTGNLGNLDDGLLSGMTSTQNPPNSNPFDLFDGDGNVNDAYNMEATQDLQLPSDSFPEHSSGFNMSDNSNLSAAGEQERQGASDDGCNNASTESQAGPVPQPIGIDKRPKSKSGRPGRGGRSPGSRPNLQCPTCGKTFNNSSAIAKHKLTHSDERKYVCHLCSKAFKRQDHLNGHMLTHRDKKPYECKFEGCDKSYSDARSLRRHLENHHQNMDPNMQYSNGSRYGPPPFLASASNTSSSDFNSSANTSSTSNQGQYFQFEKPHYQGASQNQLDGQSTWQGQGQGHGPVAYRSGDRSPGYLQQISPISPAPGQPQSHPTSPMHGAPPVRPPWSINPYESKPGERKMMGEGPKPVECSLCHRRFKNIPALNGHMRLHGGYFKKDPTPPTISVKKENSSETTEKQNGITTARTTVTGTPVASSYPHYKQSFQGAQQQQQLPAQQQQLPAQQQQIPSRSGQMLPPPQPTHGYLSQRQSAAVQQHQTAIQQQQSNSQQVGMQQQVNASPQVSVSQQPNLQQSNIQRHQAIQHALQQHTLQQQTQALHQQQQQTSLYQSPFVSTSDQLSRPNLSAIQAHLNNPSNNISSAAVTQDQLLSQSSQLGVTSSSGRELSQSNQMNINSGADLSDLKLISSVAAGVYPSAPVNSIAPSLQTLLQSNALPPAASLATGSNDLVSQQLAMAVISETQNSLSQSILPTTASGTITDSMLEDSASQLRNRLDANTITSIMEDNVLRQKFLEGFGNIYLANDKLQNIPEFAVPDPMEPHQHHNDTGGMFPPISDFMSDRKPQLTESEIGKQLSIKSPTSGHTFSFPDRAPSQLFNMPQDMDVLYVNNMKPKTDLNERKRHMSADPDKFTAPKRARNVQNSLTTLLQNRLYKRQEERALQAHNTRNDNEVARTFKIKEEIQGVQKPKFDDEVFQRPRSKAEEPMKRPNSRPEDLLSKSCPDTGALFRNPTSLQTSPLRGRRKPRPEPLFIPPHVNTFGFASRLRSPRLWDGDMRNMSARGMTPPPYTPPPMLSPVRKGAGLFWSIQPIPYRPVTPKSAPLTPKLSISRRSSTNSLVSEVLPEEPDEEPPPETDVKPHVNIGTQYQAEIPHFNANKRESLKTVSEEDLVWAPSSCADNTEEELQCYLDFACCAAIPGNGNNKEYAVHLLHLVEGDIHKALRMLMQGEARYPKGHSLASYRYQESDSWSTEEIETYHQALLKCDKDFFSIAVEIKKTTKQCIEFYYLWKKVCPDEYKRLRILRRKREQDEMYNLRSQAKANAEAQQQQLQQQLPNQDDDEDDDVDDKNNNNSCNNNNNKSSEVRPSRTNRNNNYRTATENDASFNCDYPNCSASFNSKQAVSAHQRVHTNKDNLDVNHMGGSRGKSPSNNRKPSTVGPPSNKSAASDELEEFPCRICGKVFNKIKSRSAHMKSHRPVDDKPKAKGNG